MESRFSYVCIVKLPKIYTGPPLIPNPSTINGNNIENASAYVLCCNDCLHNVARFCGNYI